MKEVRTTGFEVTLPSTLEEVKTYRRGDLAVAFLNGSGSKEVARISRIVQALYDDQYNHKPVPWNVAWEVYLCLTYQEVSYQKGARLVTGDSLFDHIHQFDEQYPNRQQRISKQGEWVQRYGRSLQDCNQLLEKVGRVLESSVIDIEAR